MCRSLSKCNNFQGGNQKEMLLLMLLLKFQQKADAVGWAGTHAEVRWPDLQALAARVLPAPVGVSQLNLL